MFFSSALRLVRDSVVVVDRDCRIVEMNPAARIFFGVRGSGAGALWPDFISSRLCDRSVPLHDLPRLLNGAEERRGSVSIKADGSPRHARYRVAGIPDSSADLRGYVITLEDRTEMLRVSEERDLYAARLESIYDNSQNGVLLYEATGSGRGFIARGWNRAAERILGVAAADVVGKSLDALSPAPFGKPVISTLKKALGDNSGPTEPMTIRAAGAGGKPVWLSMVIHPAGGGQLMAQFIDVTGWKYAVEQSGRLATAVEQAGEAIVITNAGGTIEYVNPAFEKATGYTREEAIGQTPRILKSGKHEAKFYKEMWRTLKSGSVWRGDIINRRKDGSLYHDHASIAPIKNGNGKIVNYVAVKRDITASKMAEDALRLSEQKINAIINTVSEGVIVVGLDSRISFVNHELLNIFGYKEDELIGQSVKILIPEELRKAHEIGMRRYLKGGAPKMLGRWVEMKGLRKNGSVFPLELCVRETRMEGGGRFFTGALRDISKRRMIEDALKASERRFRETLESIHLCAVQLDTNGDITFINDFLLELTGWERKEVMGRSWFEVFVPPEIHGKIRKVHRSNVREGRHYYHYENEILTRLGERRLISWNNTLLRDERGKVIGTTSIGEDITTKRATRLALKASQARLAKAQEIARMGNWEWDISTNAFTWSNEVCKICGFKFEEFGDTFDAFMEMIHPEDRERVRRSLKKSLKNKKPLNVDYRIVRPCGTELAVHCQAEVAHDDMGRPERVIGVIQDITERKRLEEKLIRQAQKLREIDAFKDKMISVISHDLRSPLTSIIGLMNLLLKSEKDPLSERQRKIVASMRDSALFQLSLVENLTELSRIQRGRIKIKPSPTRVSEIFDATVSMLGQMAMDKGIEIVERVDDDLYINVDRGKIIEVLNNLVSNSVKFTERGGTITLETEAENGEVALIVRDSGVGIEPERIEKLFDLSEKTTTLGTDGEKGTGLGLSICQEITSLNGGSLEIESTPGKGSIVRLRFKQAGARPEAAAARPGATR